MQGVSIHVDASVVSSGIINQANVVARQDYFLKLMLDIPHCRGQEHIMGAVVRNVGVGIALAFN